MRLTHYPLLRFLAMAAIPACGSNSTLDLGHGAPPSYATPETIAAGDRAPPGVPTMIASHQSNAYAIAVDDLRIYWTLSDSPSHDGQWGCSVRSCVKNDCAATLIEYGRYADSSCPGHAEHLLVNRTHLFWSSSGYVSPQRIYACPISGCPDGGPLRLVQTGHLNFTVDDDFLYWQSADATIWRCPVDRCAEQSTLIALRDSRLERVHDSLVVDATQLYWFDIEGEANVITTASKDGSVMARTLATTVASSSDLAVDTTNIYWMESTSGLNIKTCPLTGCAGEPLIVASQSYTPLVPPYGLDFAALTIDAAQMFWIARFIGAGSPTPEGLDSVRLCSTRGCGANSTALIEHQTAARRLAVDRTHVYWTSSTPVDGSYVDTAVQRIRRQP